MKPKPIKAWAWQLPNGSLACHPFSLGPILSYRKPDLQKYIGGPKFAHVEGQPVRVELRIMEAKK